MERTEYFNDTEPTQAQLNYTEDSRIRSILRRQRAGCQLGIASGFRVTVNSVDNTKIDVGPGEAYTGGRYKQLDVVGEYSGERVSTLVDSASGIVASPAAVTGQALADYTNGIKNYISLVYAESEDTSLPEIFYPFTSHNTIVREGFTVSVLTETNWNALTLTQLRQRVLVGIVTANGAGQPITTADIDQLVQPKTHPTPTQPTNITGATILSISDETLIGTGTLRYEASTKKLYWTAPGDTEGSGVAVTDSGEYTVYSFDTTYWAIVEVVYALLPAGDQTDSILIETLYGRQIPIYSAVDTAHRDLLGTGTVRPTNPHGISIEDIEGGAFDHADLFHVNGISGDADSGTLEPSLDIPNDKVLVQNPGGQANSYLIDGTTYKVIDGVSAGTDAEMDFDAAPQPDTGEYMLYLDSAAALQRVLIGSALWSANVYIVDMRNTVAGAGGSGGTVTWDSTDNSLTYEAPGDGSAGSKVYVSDLTTVPNGYYKLYSSDIDNWIIVFMNGVLGGSNSTQFDIAMTAIDQPEDGILRVCVAHWNKTTETLSNLRDIRQWKTADIKPEFLEEHDESGQHTKVFQNQFRVHVGSGPAIRAQAETVVAISGSAPNTAGQFVADTAQAIFASAPSTAGRFTAQNTAGYFVANTATGIHAVADTIAGAFSASVTAVSATAQNTAGYFQAAVDRAVYASAPNIGGMFFAGTQTAVYANADSNAGVFIADVVRGVSVSAPNTAGHFSAATAQAVYATAPNTAGRFVAATIHGINVLAPNTAGYFSANTAQAVHAQAPNTAGYFTAATGSAIYAIAPNTAGYFTADTVQAVRVEAPNTAGYFVAGTTEAIYASAPNTAGFFRAGGVRALMAIAASTVIRAEANIGDIAVNGQANNIAGSFLALQQTGVIGYGISHYGVVGRAGTSIGVYGTASVDGGLFAANNIGLRAIASTHAAAFSAGAAHSHAIIVEAGNIDWLGDRPGNDNGAIAGRVECIINGVTGAIRVYTSA